MRITKTKEQVDYLTKLKQKANVGCFTCPTCGEVYKGFGCKIAHTVYTRCKGVFASKRMKVDHYHCLVCDTEWESNEYQYTI